MIPVMQTVFGETGNCFSACLASVLEIELSEVPNFFEGIDPKDNKAWWSALRSWLNPLNLDVMSVGITLNALEEYKNAYLLVGGSSPRGNFLHAVIYHGGEMVHDPHESRAGILSIDCADLIFLVDPSKPVGPFKTRKNSLQTEVTHR